ncbi:MULTISPECIES: alpha/beta hydrolase [Rhodomicrobium]|uniref:alpha/beta hydrolase n=1 Tax=Rhodomicrobium TaxID=1068 RepID=UPI000B4A93E2|nr:MULTISPECIES: alpha/beta hydrolase [Rhodomicrobium]
MQLELLSAIPSGARRDVSVLLVHGICLGAWVWQDNFMPYLAERGFPTYALSLRGHGKSEGGERIRQWRLGDFSDDIAWAAERIGGRVAIVAHPMGGGVAQYYLRQGRRAAGLVLMASVPPHGLMRASFSMYSRNPSLWEELQKTRHGQLKGIDLGILERGLLSEPIGSEERKWLLRRLTEPAIQASLELMGWCPIAPLPWITPPLLVIGGARDDLIPPTDVHLTGLYYGVRPELIPGCAHAIMLEPSWQKAAELVSGWLVRKFDRAS